jgi:SLT domain-containing protein
MAGFKVADGYLEVDVDYAALDKAIAGVEARLSSVKDLSIMAGIDQKQVDAALLEISTKLMALKVKALSIGGINQTELDASLAEIRTKLAALQTLTNIDLSVSGVAGALAGLEAVRVAQEAVVQESNRMVIQAGIVGTFFQNWGTVIHWLVAGGSELAAVALPATFAAIAGAAVMYQGVVERVIPRTDALRTTMEALGPAFGKTSGDILGTGHALQTAQDAANPIAWSILGDAIDVARAKAGIFANTGLQVARVVQEFAARIAVDLTGAMGDRLTGLLDKAVQDLTQLGQVFGNLGHAILNFASDMPGLAEVLLRVLDAASQFILWVSNLPPWLITAAMAIEEFLRWGGLLVDIVGRMVLAFGSLSIVETVAPMIGGLGEALVGLTRDEEGASVGMLGFGKNVLMLLATTPAGWAILAAGAIGTLVVMLARAKDGTDNWIASQDQMISKASQYVVINDTVQSLVNTNQALATAQQNLNTKTSQWAAIASGAQSAVDELKAQHQLLNSEIVTETSNVGYISTTYGVTFTQALAIAQAAGVNLTKSLTDNSNAAAIARQQILGLVTGYISIGQTGGALGASMNAVSYQTTLQNTDVSKLNQAWDQYFQILTGGTGGLASFMGDLQQITQNVTNQLTSQAKTANTAITSSSSAAVKQAQAAVDQARAVLDSMKATGTSTNTALTGANTAYQQAQANAKNATAQVDQARAAADTARANLQSVTASGASTTSAAYKQADATYKQALATLSQLQSVQSQAQAAVSQASGQISSMRASGATTTSTAYQQADAAYQQAQAHLALLQAGAATTSASTKAITVSAATAIATVAQQLTGFSGTSVQAWQSFNAAVTQAGTLSDWLRTAMASGALGSGQYQEAIKGIVGQLLPFAADSKAAQAELIGLAQQVNPNITNFTQLTHWVGNTKKAQDSLNGAVITATEKLGNLNSIAQSFTGTLQTDVIGATANAALAQGGFQKLLSATTDALQKGGDKSKAYKDALVPLDAFLRDKLGWSTQQINTYNGELVKTFSDAGNAADGTTKKYQNLSSQGQAANNSFLDDTKNVLAAMNNAWNAWTLETAQNIVNWGMDLWNGLINAENRMDTWLTSAKNWATNVGKNVWGSVETFLKTYLNVNLEHDLAEAYTNMNNWLGNAEHWAASVVTSVWTAAETGFKQYMVTDFLHDLNTAYNQMNSWLSTAVSWVNRVGSEVWGALETGFKTAVSAIGQVWSTLENIFETPVNFLIHTVYDNGIAKLWNDVAGVVPGIPTLPTLASGSKINESMRVPGFGGGDIIPALVEPGETVVSKEHSNMLAGIFKAVGVPGFATGGIPGGGVLHNIVSGAKSVGSGIVSGITDVASLVAGLATGNTSALLNDLLGSIGAGGATGDLAKMIIGVPTTLVHDLIGTMAGAFKSLISSAVGSPVPNVGSGVTRWTSIVDQALLLNHLSTSLASKVLYQMQTESGGDPNAINLTDTNAAAGDPSRGLLQTIMTTFQAYHVAGTSNNIYDPLANVAAAINYAAHVYGPSLQNASGMGIGSGHGYSAGGYLPAGRWGYVGENGPEVATSLPGGGTRIAPMSGGDLGSRLDTLISLTQTLINTTAAVPAGVGKNVGSAMMTGGARSSVQMRYQRRGA